MRHPQYSLAFFLITVVLFFGCRKESEPNKIIDGFPILSNETVVPAQALQQFLGSTGEAMAVLVGITNRTTLVTPRPTYPELTGPDGQSRYVLSVARTRYGNASFTLQFRNTTGAVIDPIQNQTSTSTLSTVSIIVSGSSSQHNYSGNLALALETGGNPTSRKRVTGSVTFTGSGYTITYTLVGSGAGVNAEGFIDGLIAASGSGAGHSTNASLAFLSNHDVNGTIAWEGKEGGIHINSSGTGYIVTNQQKILLY